MAIYGRRRCGKSRLLLESLDPSRDVYFQADLRDAAAQRQALAREIARRISRFDSALYPDWSAILEAWREREPAGAGTGGSHSRDRRASVSGPDRA